MADIYLAPQVNNAKRFHIDVSQFPTIHRIAETLAQEPAFIESHPSNMPDVPKSQ